MGLIALEIFIILLLLLANGVFAMTELAVLSARKARLRQLAEKGDRAAAAALELTAAPNRFLSTVQIGITLISICAGAFGGATLAQNIGAALATVSGLERYAESLGVVIVVITLTYFSLIIGELVPKRLALGNAEGIARFMAGPMTVLARFASPVVHLLGVSTDLILKMLRVKPPQDEGVTDDEVRVLMQEGMMSGVFHSTEPKMVESVLALDHLPVSEIMTPRAKVIFLNKADPHEAVWHKIVISGHSSFPVYEGQRDNIVGVISVKAIYANLAAGARANVADLTVQPLIVPATQFVTQLLDSFKTSGKHVALVADEFGTIVGLITLVDVLEAIVGDIATPEERLRPMAKRRDDGSWLVDGAIEIEELQRTVPAFIFPESRARSYGTLAGFTLAQFGRVPHEGECFDWLGYRFEVIDMDRHRVDKLLILPPPVAGSA